MNERNRTECRFVSLVFSWRHERGWRGYRQPIREGLVPVVDVDCSRVVLSAELLYCDRRGAPLRRDEARGCRAQTYARSPSTFRTKDDGLTGDNSTWPRERIFYLEYRTPDLDVVAFRRPSIGRRTHPYSSRQTSKAPAQFVSALADTAE